MLSGEQRAKQIEDIVLQNAAADLCTGFLRHKGSPPYSADPRLYWKIVKELRNSGVTGEIKGPDDVSIFYRTAKIYAPIIESSIQLPIRSRIELFLEEYREMKKGYLKDKKENFG